MDIMDKKIFFVIIFICLAPLKSIAQDEKSLLAELNKLNNEIMTQTKEKHGLHKLLTLQALQKQYRDNPYSNILFPQLIAEEMSYLNMHIQSIQTMSAAEENKESSGFDINNYTTSAAKNVLQKYLKSSNIVMINEAHHVDQHRAFTINMLENMWKRGFRYLALENLSEHFDKGIKDTYITQDIGAYSQSVYIGLMLLHAKDIGFKLISYDYNRSGSSNQREENAAEILFNKVFKQDPNAKIVIHCGYSHIDEQKKLAAKLLSITGHDPFTINQTDLMEGTIEKENPTYSAISKKITQSYPIVLLDKTKKLWSYKPKSYDVNVIWPRMTKENNRRNWERLNRKAQKIRANICVNYPCMIESFSISEDTDVLPQDRIVIWNKDDDATIFYTEKTFIKVSELNRQFWVHH